MISVLGNIIQFQIYPAQLYFEVAKAISVEDLKVKRKLRNYRELKDIRDMRNEVHHPPALMFIFRTVITLE